MAIVESYRIKCDGDGCEVMGPSADTSNAAGHAAFVAGFLPDYRRGRRNRILCPACAARGAAHVDGARGGVGQGCRGA